jgi:hypothetical protein
VWCDQLCLLKLAKCRTSELVAEQVERVRSGPAIRAGEARDAITRQRERVVELPEAEEYMLECDVIGGPDGIAPASCLDRDHMSADSWWADDVVSVNVDVVVTRTGTNFNLRSLTASNRDR